MRSKDGGRAGHGHGHGHGHASPLRKIMVVVDLPF